MKNRTFNCEIITPMFLSSTNKLNPELRPPSIKAMMRFWWRAINYNSDNNELKNKEGKIFGSADENFGKSKVIVRVKNADLNGNTSKDNLPNNYTAENVVFHRNNRDINLLNYFAYGPIAYNRNLRRPECIYKYIIPETKFDIVLKYKEEYEKDILKSLFFLSTFGSLGAKSRNGFGNFIIKNISEFEPLGDLYTTNPVKNDNLKKILNQNIPNNSNNNLPKYTSLSRTHTKLYKLNNSYEKALDALTALQEIYLRTRVLFNNENSSNNYTINDRVYLGSPIMAINKKDRRSKPYFIRVLRDGDGKYHSYLLYMGAEFTQNGNHNAKFKEINNVFINNFRDNNNIKKIM
ncbi:MAG: type III-B CRISPR module RAMP protein Cmr1 [Spirochaetota bacterium]